MESPPLTGITEVPTDIEDGRMDTGVRRLNCTYSLYLLLNLKGANVEGEI